MADNAGTPPAPATPAPASAPVPVSTSEAPKSNVEVATERALANIREMGHAVPDTSDATSEPGERGRRGDGTFRPGPAKGEQREAQPAAPAANTAPDDGLEPQGEIEDEGDESDDSTTRGAGTDAEGAEDELLVVGPGRRDGEEVEIAAPDKETAERLRQWVNSAQRVDEVDSLREDAVAMRREVEEFQEMLATDPAGVVTQGLEGNPEAQRHLALYLLTRPDIWQQVRDTVMQLDDAERFEFVQAKVELERHTLADQFRSVAEENRAVDQNLRDVQSAVAAVIPPEVGEATRTQFFRDALRDIAAYADRHGRLTIDVRDIPLIIAQRLSANGIDPVQAASRIAEGNRNTRRNRSTENRTAAVAPAQRSASRTAPKPPQRTGAQMVQGARRRVVASAIPGGGAGAQGNSPEKPPFDPSLGTSATEQAIAWHRKRTQTSR